jgi:tetraacyldisaccharide 4'-kinase
LKIAENQELYFTSIEFDEFIYSEKGERKVKMFNTDKLLLAGIAKPHLFCILQAANDVYGFPRPSSF